MRILWISSFARKKEDGYNPPIAGPGAVSGSIFQESLISGLEDLGVQVDVIMDYPYQSGRFHKRTSYITERNSIDYILPHINIGLLSHFVKPFFIKRAISDLLKKNEYDVVISYLIHTPYMKGIKYLKRKKNIKSILICPDLPDMMDMSLNRKPIKKFFKSLDYKTIKSLYSYIDNYILFSKLMEERIPIENKKTMVLEGIASVEDLDITPRVKQKAIMYAGTLHRNIGIERIIDSLYYLPDELEFWIFGDGELKEDIEDLSKNNKRIKYMGFVDRTTLFEYEKTASLLINARNPQAEFTKYSFPSKTFEYLYSGTPFLTTKLSGVPNEYNDYLFFLPSDDPIEIAKEIEKVLSMDDLTLNKHIDATRLFVNKKTKKYQCRKVYDFILNCIR